LYFAIAQKSSISIYLFGNDLQLQTSQNCDLSIIRKLTWSKWSEDGISYLVAGYSNGAVDVWTVSYYGSILSVSGARIQPEDGRNIVSLMFYNLQMQTFITISKGNTIIIYGIENGKEFSFKLPILTSICSMYLY
jgi:WD40 repeat protein